MPCGKSGRLAAVLEAASGRTPLSLLTALSPVPEQALLFHRLRFRMVRNQIRGFFRTSPLRFVALLVCSVLIGGGVFAVSFEGFHYLNDEKIPFSGTIIGTLFDVLFLSLAVMLTFSSGIILYSSLFGSSETAFLLSTPANDDQVFAYKFQGAIAFSSWAFVLLGARCWSPTASSFPFRGISTFCCRFTSSATRSCPVRSVRSSALRSSTRSRSGASTSWPWRGPSWSCWSWSLWSASAECCTRTPGTAITCRK